jgi:uncharacterized membrane protein
MTQLIIALAAFVGTHFAMSHPLRAPLAARLGEQGFQLGYTLVSFATLGWAVLAFRAAPVGTFAWPVGDGLWLASTLIMLLASILLMGSFIRNPAMPMPGAAAAAAAAPKGVFAITRHPMMWSFALWSLAHALVWPQPSVLVLCAGIALLALVGSAGQDAKKARLQPEFWPAWRAKTGFVPFTGPAGLRAMWPGWGVLLGGVVLWLVATWLHPVLGAPSVGVWR